MLFLFVVGFYHLRLFFRGKFKSGLMCTGCASAITVYIPDRHQYLMCSYYGSLCAFIKYQQENDTTAEKLGGIFLGAAV